MSDPSPHSDHQHSRTDTCVDELVLVVHGVGDPQPGETLSLFARSVAESQYPLTEHQEILWLADEPDEDRVRDVQTFPCHTRHLEFGDNRSTLSEIYWGDLSRVKRGLIGIMSGMVSIIFGLRYVAFVASEQSGWAARGLQTLGLICSRMLHGPVLAVNFVLAMLILTVAVTESLWPGSSQVAGWANVLIFGCVLVCLLASFLGWRLTRNSVCHRFWYWVMISALFLDGLMLINLFIHEPFPLVHYCNIMVTMLGAQWISLVVALLVMVAFWLLAIMQKGTYRPALHVAMILPALAVGLWGQVLPMLWVAGSSFLLPQSTENALISQYSTRFESQQMGPLPSGYTLDQAEAVNAAESSVILRDQLAEMFDRAVPLLGVQFVMTLFLGAVLILQLARFMQWAEKTTLEDFHEGRRGPRLIVNGAVQFLLIKCATIGMILVMYIGILEILGNDHRENWLCQYMVEANKYAVGFLVPIAGVLFLSVHYLRPGLDIVLDIVNHFYFRSATSDDRKQNEGEDFDIDEVTFNGGEFYFSRRDTIHRRMKRILDYYRRTLTGKPALTIVSHSQGTMIAIEVLNDEELDWVTQKFSRVNFITMGSPFHHIYQQYFSHFYPPLDAPMWERLRGRVSRWLNIFRIDDYVGTDIDFPRSLPQVTSGRYSNHAVQRRGHSYYWRDRQVLDVIQENNICRSLTTTSERRRRAA